MSDTAYFACLGFSILSGVVAVVKASSIIRMKGDYSSGIALAISCSVGFVSTLPFRNTREMHWLPAVAGAFFGAVVLSTVLCCLCQIRDKNQSRQTEETDQGENF